MWHFELTGDDADLKALVEDFSAGDIRVFKEGDKYFLSSPRFEGLVDANAARDEALLVEAIINGTRSVGLNGTEPVRVGNGYTLAADGKHGITLFAGLGEYSLRGIPAGLTALLHDGETQRGTGVRVREWALVALRDAAVAKVFSINASPPLDWFDLYRILEIVGDDIGDIRDIEPRGWMPRGAVNLLKWTANSSEVLDLDARHGVQRHDSPSNPMPLGEARTLIRTLTWHWLLSKTPVQPDKRSNPAIDSATDSRMQKKRPL